jgi:hypothetical protein
MSSFDNSSSRKLEFDGIVYCGCCAKMDALKKRNDKIDKPIQRPTFLIHNF